MHKAETPERDALRREFVTREYLDSALAKLRTDLERSVARGSRTDGRREIVGPWDGFELFVREQTNKVIRRTAVIAAIEVAIAGAIIILF